MELVKSIKTQVCIIGSGPSGLLLSQLLHNAGIESVVLDRQSRAHIESRIRAGVLEHGSVETLVEAGVGERMLSEGILHDGFDVGFDGERFRIDLKALTGKSVMIYGQTELTRDLIATRLEQGGSIVFSADNVTPSDLESGNPVVRYEKEGEQYEVHCQFVAGCDGFRGVSRESIPRDRRKYFERVYPFGWLGLLSDTKPVADELIYANHERGFALCSMRSNTRSRYYIQCPADEDVNKWSDDAFFDELSLRIGEDTAAGLERGPSLEKSIAPLRSFVCEPMRFGNLFLAGDAAHIVPPTGAKGLNLAISDVHYLARAMVEHFKSGNSVHLDAYSQTCLTRVWKVERFSWYMSSMLHQFPDHSPFEKRMQRAEYDYVTRSHAGAMAIAENYVGLPYD